MTDYIGPERQIPVWAGRPTLRVKTYGLGVRITGISPWEPSLIEDTLVTARRDAVEGFAQSLFADAFSSGNAYFLDPTAVKPVTRRERIVRRLRYYRRRFATWLHALGSRIDADSISECYHDY